MNFKTLKRPMFRRGGDVGTGIMSGVRENFAEKGMTDDTEKMIQRRKEYYSKYMGDPIANALIQGGLGLVSGEGAGKGTLGALATAYKKPVEQALSAQQQIGLKAVGDVLGAEDAERIALIKAKQSKIAAEKQAVILLSAEGITNPTQDQINKKAAEIINKGLTGSTYGPTAVRQRRKEALMDPGGANYSENQAENQVQYEQITSPKLRQKGYTPGGRIKKDKKKGKYKTEGKPAGVYIDIDSNQLIEIKPDGTAAPFQFK